jgi:DUF4097 and DUF4098 domain-containing protein YvlB
MTEHRFETHEPVHLYVEVGRGSVQVQAEDTTETLVEISGRDAEEVAVEQSGRQVSVVAPRQRGMFGGDKELHVRVRLPLESELAIKTGSADVGVEGTVGPSKIRTGSGDLRMDDVTGPLLFETGSGDLVVDVVSGELRAKSGSGDVSIRLTAAAVAVSTGSGDVQLGRCDGPTTVKTGSGDIHVTAATGDLSLVTGSGDLVVGSASRGRLTFKGASGDVRVGIPAGTPVWTDISTVSGSLRSDLQGVGQPEAGADHVEVRATTVSGDVVLSQV